MAIQFTTGTINQPDAGSVGLSMVERIRDDVVAHAAWDLVEEYTAASGTVRWYAFKCLAAQSGLPNDFFIIICRVLGSGKLHIFPCESYVTAGHTAQFFAPDAFSSVFNFDANGQFANTYVLGTAYSPGGSNPHALEWTPSGTSTKWWITVDNDGFTVAFNGASNGYFHCGAYTPLTQLPISMPILCTGSSDTSGCLTRNPALANLTSQAGSGLHVQQNDYLGFYNADLQYNDKLQGNQRAVAEQGLNTRVFQATNIPAQGYVLGKQKRMRVSASSQPVGMAFGDAYVVQNRLWVPWQPTSAPRMWDTGVAAS